MPGLWVALSLAALVTACAPPRRPEPPPLALPPGLLVQAAGRVISVPLEDYVLGTILAEVAPISEPASVIQRIFEVQAVVARSYAVTSVGRHRKQGFDVCDTTHCQIYDPARIRTSRLAPAARQAVMATSGQILAYARRPAEALFHADCGGSTAAADAVWGGPPVPYLLQRVDDLLPRTHRSWRWSASAEDLRAAFSRDAKTDVGMRLVDIAVVTRDGSGRAQQVALRGDVARSVRGEDFRAVINRALGVRTIQSTRLSVTRTGSTYLFEGTGFGHGVGLCQAGAAARARRGEATSDILAAYFADAGVVQVR